MYQNYFGFKERPFQLVPNPAYLFLSRSHEEAMAHLTYAVREGDGFIAIIGEVGTGKTTLCRAFIEGLDERCEVAYIFNPKLTAVELLEAVCDEFALDAPAGGTTKDLIDTLNRFLLEKRADGKQVMLIIDEAQNLSREVLEQLRLLSNLETNTEKLLQIVLVGQPELDDLLKTFELRQLSQRITLRCHLAPLTFQEAVQYIQHRIRIAARNQGVVFTQTAFRKIFAASGGIPRRIHIVCDRSLLVAYVTNREKITGPVVDSAIQELGTLNAGGLRTVEKRKTALLTALLLLLVVMFFVVKPMNSGISPQTDSKSGPVPESAAEPSGTALSPPLPAATASEQAVAPSSARPLADFLAGIDPVESKKTALSGALSLWGASLPIREHPDRKLTAPETYFKQTAGMNGFLVHRMQGSLDIVSKMNLPAIFEFARPGAIEPRFLTLCRISGRSLSFLSGAGGGPIVALPEDVKRLWTGIAYIPWTNFSDYQGMTPIGGGDEGVRKLKQLLEEIGFSRLSPDSVYDAETQAAVEDIQLKYGIPVDGLVGPLTKMALYNELPGLDIPHIRENESRLQPTESKVTH